MSVISDKNESKCFIIDRANIPDNLPINGNIEVNSANLQAILTSEGFVKGFKIELNLTVDATVSGFQMERYYSRVSRTLADKEFVGLMKHLDSDQKVALK